jgi:hypothetical protein
MHSITSYDPQAYEPTPSSPRGFPRFLSIRGARGLHAFDLALLTNLLLTHFIYEFYPSHLLEKGLKYN